MGFYDYRGIGFRRKEGKRGKSQPVTGFRRIGGLKLWEISTDL